MPAPTPNTSASRTTARRRSSRGSGGAIISGSQVAVVVALAIGLAYLLIPKDAELLERLVEDGHHDRARQLVIASGAATANRDDASGTEDGAREATPEENAALDLVVTLLENESGNIGDKTAGRVATLIEITGDPDAVLRLLKQHATRFTDKGYADCMRSLAMRSVQLSEPGKAADIYQLVWEVDVPDQAQLQDMVAACRYAGRPRQALDAISRFLGERNLPFSRLSDEMRMTAVSLHRELNDGSGAFDLLSEEYGAAVDADTRHKLIDLMTETAVQSERLEDCIPVVDSYVATLDAMSTPWRDLLQRDTPHASDEDFRKYATVLARHHEWKRESDAAFDLYRKLAALGDLAALDRCVTIYPWVARQDDATDLLAALAPIDERPQHTLLTARLEADRGNLDRAVELMEPALEATSVTNSSNSSDVSDSEPVDLAGTWFEFARILDETGRYEKAISAYQRAMELNPNQAEPPKFAARLQIALGRNEAALTTLSQLPDEAHDAKSLEDYLMLASALGDAKGEERALAIRIARHADAPLASDYEDLSELWQIQGDSEKAIAAAREGLKALPESRAMVLNLADQLVTAGQFEKALGVLRQHDDPEDNRFSARLLTLASSVTQPTLVLDLIDRRSGEAQWTPGQRRELADLYEVCQRPEAALKVYRSLPGGESEASRLEAGLAYARGDARSAVNHQRRYLEQCREPDYEGWMFYGDLLQATGDRTAARNAYQTALDILHGRFNSTTARWPSDLPTAIPEDIDNVEWLQQRLGETLADRRGLQP